MSTQNHFDVIIIGSGAGGGTLAHKLAPTGKRILLLERGGYVPREKDNWNPRAVNFDGKYQTGELLRLDRMVLAISPKQKIRASFPARAVSNDVSPSSAEMIG